MKKVFKKRFQSFSNLILLMVIFFNYKLVFANEISVIRDTKTSCQIFDLKASEFSATWSAACVDGKISGEGTLTVSDLRAQIKCEVVGAMKEGLRFGKSITTCSNGVKIEGDHQPIAGVVNGKGEMSFPGGNKYVGEFKGWTMHGQGVITRADGKSMQGTFADNKLVQAAKNQDSSDVGTNYSDLLKETFALFVKGGELFNARKFDDAQIVFDQFIALHDKLPQQIQKEPKAASLVSNVFLTKMAMHTEYAKSAKSAKKAEKAEKAEKAKKQVDQIINLADELSKRFIDNKTPDVELNVAAGLALKGLVLYDAKRFPDALIPLDIVLQKFEESKDEKIQIQVSSALSTKAYVLYEQKKYSAALSLFDKHASQFKLFTNPDVQRDTASTSNSKCYALFKLEKLQESKTCLEEFQDKYQSSTNPIILKAYAHNVKSLLALNEAGIVSRNSNLSPSVKPDLQVAAAKATIENAKNLYKPVSKMEQIRAISQIGSNDSLASKSTGFDTAMSLLDSVVKSLGGSTDPAVQEQVATALYSQCDILSHEAGMSGQETSCLKEGKKRFENIQIPKIQSLVKAGNQKLGINLDAAQEAGESMQGVLNRVAQAKAEKLAAAWASAMDAGALLAPQLTTTRMVFK
jgi:hypothetical protein